MAAVCSAPVAALTQPVSAKVHYLLTGTFNTVFLYLLAFNPSTASLSIHAKVKGEGPHQFWALNGRRDRAYGTTWGAPPSLSAWEVVEGGRGGIEKINTVPITATSSYIQLNPDSSRIYSAGGPTGEVHAVDETTGGFGKKLQELLYVEKEDLEAADKTRVALRYGSHSIDLNLPRRQAFVPHLGHNSIFMYSVSDDGTLTLVNDVPSFGDGHDGPRHVVPHPKGHLLYAVTEHTSFVDVYEIEEAGLKHRQRLSVIPPGEEPNRLSYRGDTLRFSFDNRFLFVTTRGKTSATKGYVSVWAVDSNGLLGTASSSSGVESHAPLDRWQTPTSGGKANAVETFPFHPSGRPVEKEWIALTDDQDGWVWILEWNGKEISELAGVQLGVGEEGEEKGVGASHAVWLS